jgi:hypothetical protein
MRLRVYIFASIAALMLSAQSLAAPASVTVSELLAHPGDHYDQRLKVNGVVGFTTDGPSLCEIPSNAQSRDCIDIATDNSPIRRFDWSKRGALVSIVGYFSFTCPPDEVDRVICFHRGSHGFINVETLAIYGYSACAGYDCRPDANAGAHEVGAADPVAAGVTEFARALVSAARSRRSERIAAITLPSMRTETRFDLEPRASFDRYYSELANAPAWVTQPGRGFRLFDVDKDEHTARHHELCFCIKGDCASHWREATADLDNRMFRCHYVWRDANSWYLLY